jgi:uncharacterized protein
MARRGFLRFVTVVGVFAADAILAATLLIMTQGLSGAQFFEERFPYEHRQQRGSFDWFAPAPLERAVPRRERAPQERAAPPDYSKAPAPKKTDSKTETAAAVPVMVLGDAMADWLGYGLELAYADSPEIGILRQHVTNSGLIRSDPREYPDWPKAARDVIAAQKPKFVLMMIGVNDRRQIHEAAAASAQRVAKSPPQPADNAALELDKPDKPAEPSTGAPLETVSSGNQPLEFRTDAWSEAYIRRIDDTVAALKTSGVPVFWVGLPPLRGQKAAADTSFLNDLYRSRADKAGIIYIDVWDGFVDDDGRYAQ